MKKTVFAALVIAAGLAGVLVVDRYQQFSVAPVTESGTASVVPLAADTTNGVAAAGMVKEFTVNGANYSFSPSTMTVKKGDTVRIRFENIEGFHDFKIDELNVATKQFRAGGGETVEFAADKAGTFEYYCSVGHHRASGMRGTLVVEE